MRFTAREATRKSLGSSKGHEALSIAAGIPAIAI
jgi:hypothetical protein